MRINLISKGCGIQVVLNETLDAKECQAIRTSDRPASKAFDIAKRRLGVFEGIYPAQQCLEGL